MRSEISKPASLRTSLRRRISSRGEAFLAELVVECGVERGRGTALLRERELVVGRGADLDVVGGQVEGRSVGEAERVVTLGLDRAAHLEGRRNSQGILHLRGAGTRLRPETPEVRDDHVVEQTFEVGDELDVLHVERVGDFRDRRIRERDTVREHDERAAQRLAHLETRVVACVQTE